MLSKKNVEVVPYNQNWPHIFAIEANKIKAALGNNFVEIHHVGSTSVHGLDAKPTIDIICCVNDLNLNHKSLTDLQYEYKGGFNLPFRKTFTYRSPHLKVNLHIFEKDDPEVELNLLFCDYLRAHPEARDQYAALKYKLLEDERSHKKNGPIYKGYTLGKHDFIQNILKKAGFNRLRFVFCTYDTEWQTIKKMRNQYFFEQCKTEDPYTWTFDSQNHKHFVLYKGINIIGYAHIQLFWENKEAAIRLILTENNVYTKNIITLIEKWLKLEGYHLLKQEAQNMLKIDLLKNHPSAISTLAHIWHEVLGKIWMPEIEIDEIKALFYEELNQDIPLTYIALYNDIPVGSCTLELQGGIRPDLGPWIGDLVVDPKYQKQGIGKKLLNTTVVKAKELGFKQLYLFTFDHAIAEYYQHLGWSKIGMDTFKGHPVIIMKVEL